MLVIDSERIPIKAWTDEQNLYADYNVLQQARNLANHPLSVKWVGLMPDFHLGYGMPIGGVVATKGGVIPNAVGVDIGCGMIAIKTPLQTDVIDQMGGREFLQKLRLSIHQRVPVGNASHKQPVKHKFTDQLDDDREHTDLIEKLQLQNLSHVQMGTLGGGNHFIEIQRDAEDNVWIMLHTGSRGIGMKICNHYHGIAKKYMEDYRSSIPDMDLAFLPESCDEYKQYLADMGWAMRFAELNRESIWAAIEGAFLENGVVFELDQKFDTHHNFAQMENHFNENVLVHRKGAVQAKEGVLVTIPGSMGTNSYIGRGLGNKLSFETCSHGAGRVLSRGAANKEMESHEKAVEMMSHVVFGVKHGSYDEHPHAYKDIGIVMEHQKDLVEPAVKLWPMAVVKG